MEFRLAQQHGPYILRLLFREDMAPQGHSQPDAAVTVHFNFAPPCPATSQRWTHQYSKTMIEQHQIPQHPQVGGTSWILAFLAPGLALGRLR